jgi:hypothetical protein
MSKDTMQDDMKNHIVQLAKRGQLNKREKTNDKEKTVALFKSAPRGLNAAVARFFVEASPETTEATLINWAKNTNGLTKGQASALCLSAQAYAVRLLDEAGHPAIVNKKTVVLVPDLVQAALEAHFADDDLDEDATDDLADDMDDDDDELMDDFNEAPDTTATVTADHIPYAELKAALMDADTVSAMTHACFLAFKDEPNKRKDGTFNRFYGKSTKGLDMSVAKKPEAFFKRKVADFCGIQLLGISPNRGNDWATDHLLKGGEHTSAPNPRQNKAIRESIGALFCIIAVKAGVTVFNHDLRRYISEATVKKLRDSWVCEDADMTHSKAATNGWFLPFNEGESADVSDLIDEAASLLI